MVQVVLIKSFDNWLTNLVARAGRSPCASAHGLRYFFGVERSTMAPIWRLQSSWSCSCSSSSPNNTPYASHLPPLSWSVSSTSPFRRFWHIYILVLSSLVFLPLVLGLKKCYDGCAAFEWHADCAIRCTFFFICVLLLLCEWCERLVVCDVSD